MNSKQRRKARRIVEMEESELWANSPTNSISKVTKRELMNQFNGKLTGEQMEALREVGIWVENI